MQVSLFKKRIFWWTVGLLFIYFISSIREILFPFIMALILGHIGNPVIEKFVEYKIPRWLGSLIFTASISAVVVLFVIKILPIIISEIEDFLALIPTYSNNFMVLVLPKINQYINNFGEKFVQQLYGNAEAFFEYIFLYLLQIIKNFFSSGAVIINILSLVFLTPIITFYVLRDWPGLVTKVERLLPVSSSHTIHLQLAEINRIIHKYLKGQLIIISAMSVIFAVILYLFNIKFIVFLALMSGILSIIPYLGFGLSLGTILLVAYSQFQDVKLLIFLGLSLIGVHIIESNYLTPKLLGDNIGLHPIVIIFVVMVGGLYFGLLGAILAIPVAAIFSLFAKMLVNQYLLSDYSK